MPLVRWHGGNAPGQMARRGLSRRCPWSDGMEGIGQKIQRKARDSDGKTQYEWTQEIQTWKMSLMNITGDAQKEWLTLNKIKAKKIQYSMHDDDQKDFNEMYTSNSGRLLQNNTKNYHK